MKTGMCTFPAATCTNLLFSKYSAEEKESSLAISPGYFAVRTKTRQLNSCCPRRSLSAKDSACAPKQGRFRDRQVLRGSLLRGRAARRSHFVPHTFPPWRASIARALKFMSAVIGRNLPSDLLRLGSCVDGFSFRMKELIFGPVLRKSRTLLLGAF